QQFANASIGSGQHGPMPVRDARQQTDVDDDIVEVVVVIDAGDPRGVGRARSGERAQQEEQRHDEQGYDALIDHPAKSGWITEAVGNGKAAVAHRCEPAGDYTAAVSSCNTELTRVATSGICACGMLLLDP